MTTNKYGIECVGRRRPTWKRRLGCWLWTLIACVLAAWVIRMIWAVLATIKHAEAGRPMLRAAGWELPEWVAFGVVGTLVAAVMARLGWGAMLEAFQIRELSEPPEHDEMEVGGNAVPPTDEEPWMKELRAMLRRRNTVITDRQCRQIKALCVPTHRMDLVMLDAFMRRELGLRLFVTTLKEVQSICGKAGDGKAQAGKPMLRDGKGGVVA